MLIDYLRIVINRETKKGLSKNFCFLFFFFFVINVINRIKVWCTTYPRHPAPSCNPLCPSTILYLDPLFPSFPWNARHLGGGGDVSRMRTQDWPLPHWRHRGWLHALVPPTPDSSHAGCNRHREMVHDSSKPQFSKAVRTERSPYVSPSSSTWRRTFLLFPRLLLLFSLSSIYFSVLLACPFAKSVKKIWQMENFLSHEISKSFKLRYLNWIASFFLSFFLFKFLDL